MTSQKPKHPISSKTLIKLTISKHHNFRIKQLENSSNISGVLPSSPSRSWRSVAISNTRRFKPGATDGQTETFHCQISRCEVRTHLQSANHISVLEWDSGISFRTFSSRATSSATTLSKHQIICKLPLTNFDDLYSVFANLLFRL